MCLRYSAAGYVCHLKFDDKIISFFFIFKKLEKAFYARREYIYIYYIQTALARVIVYFADAVEKLTRELACPLAVLFARVTSLEWERRK